MHVENFVDLSDVISSHICILGNKLARKITEVLKPLRVGFVVSGFGVPHAHYHVIPMEDINDISSSRYVYIKDGQIEFGTSHMIIPSYEEQQKIAKLIAL